LNGKVFAGLSKLKKVDLGRNECIDKEFGANEIATIVQNIPKACLFDEQIETIDETSTQTNEECEGILREQKELEAELKSEIETLKNETIRLQTQAQNDESDIAKWKKEAQQCNNQVKIQGSALMFITVMLITFTNIMCF
jgi:predicted RNase H-like nuclease (RuvC/YqgF family)